MTSLKPSDFRAVNRRGLLGRLATDSRGSTAALMAMAFIPVLIMLGGGVDLGRGYVVQSQLQTAVDSAALAAAQSCKTKDSGTSTIADTTDAVPQANSYFNENFPDNYMGTTDKKLTQDEMCTGDSFMRVSLTGEAVVPYSIMKIAGFKTKKIEAKAVAETGTDPATIEAVMVLDVTGSMSTTMPDGITRIAALRNAANDFVDIVYQAKEMQPGIAVGMVPYNVVVNPGRFATSNLTKTVEPLVGFTNLTSGPLAWNGCVRNDSTIQNMSGDLNTQDKGAWDIRKEFRGFGSDTAPHLRPFLYHPTWVRKNMTENPSPTNDFFAFEPLLGAGGYEDNRYKLGSTTAQANAMALTPAYKQFFKDRFIGLNNGAGTMDDDVIVTPTNAYYDRNSTADFIVRTDKLPRLTEYRDASDYGIGNFSANARSPNAQCPSPIREIAYGEAKSAHQGYVNANIQSFSPGAGTIHHAGMLWGYRMLQNTAAFPRTNPTTKKAKRVMLFMTDGNFELNHWSTNTSIRARWNDAMYSTYERLRNPTLTTSTNPDTVKVAASLRFSKICQAAKNEGVAVYVIALAINDPASDAMFSGCAPGDKYKKTNNSQELREAFREIARETIDLHIVS